MNELECPAGPEVRIDRVLVGARGHDAQPRAPRQDFDDEAPLLAGGRVIGEFSIDGGSEGVLPWDRI